MTGEILSVLLILAAALGLFISDKLRADLVALMVLCALALTGLVTPAQALSGFSNPAVVTIWAMFILSAGLGSTGIADVIGARLLKLAGSSEWRVVLVVMLATGGLSAFMNNIGVAAMMLPVLMDISRRAGIPASRLLMPMAFASLLGGLTTLVGTSLNLVASGALVESGHQGLTLLSFTPAGLPALLLGSVFVALAGRRLLPRLGGDATPGGGAGQWQFAHGLEERQFTLRVSDRSPLHERPLKESCLGAMLGLNVRSLRRGDIVTAPVDGDCVLRAGDLLETQGRLEDFQEFARWQALEVARGPEIAELLSPRRLALVSLVVAPGSDIDGITIREADFRRRFGAHILTTRRGDNLQRARLADWRLQAGDRLQVELEAEAAPELLQHPAFEEAAILTEETFDQIYPDSVALLELDIPADSRLAGRAVKDSGLGDALGLRVVAIGRKPRSIFIPSPEEIIEPGDKLLVTGGQASMERVAGLQSLELVEGDVAATAATDSEILAEVTLSPRSTLAGRSLRDLDFRRRYGAQILSIWRRGRAHRSHLRHFTLEFGDALLLAGPRDRIRALRADSDFLFLTKLGDEEEKSTRLAPLAAAIMLGVVAIVLAGALPVAIAALSGAALMVLTGCLSMEAAHKAIDWKSVFLIACMMPMGTAMEGSGTAAWLAGGIVALTAPFGPWALVLALYLATAVGAALVPAAAMVLIMSMVGIDAATAAGVSPQTAVLAVAFAAAASFATPIAHPASLMVMGPGGYRFGDYARLGIPLALLVMLTVLPIILWLG